MVGIWKTGFRRPSPSYSFWVLPKPHDNGFMRKVGSKRRKKFFGRRRRLFGCRGREFFDIPPLFSPLPCVCRHDMWIAGSFLLSAFLEGAEEEGEGEEGPGVCFSFPPPGDGRKNLFLRPPPPSEIRYICILREWGGVPHTHPCGGRCHPRQKNTSKDLLLRFPIRRHPVAMLSRKTVLPCRMNKGCTSYFLLSESAFSGTSRIAY